MKYIKVLENNILHSNIKAASSYLETWILFKKSYFKHCETSLLLL